MTNDEVKAERVRICDQDHPHYGESGHLTGKIISLFDHCPPGTDRCFVKKGQVAADRRRAR